MKRVNRAVAGHAWNEVDFDRGHAFGKPWVALNMVEQEFVRTLIEQSVEYVNRLEDLPQEAGSIIVDATVELFDSHVGVPVLVRDEDGMWYGVDDDGKFRGFIDDTEIASWRHGSVSATA